MKLHLKFRKIKLMYRLILIYAIVFIISVLAIGWGYSASLNMITTESMRFTEQITGQLKLSLEHTLDSLSTQIFSSYTMRNSLGKNLESLCKDELSSSERQKIRFRIETSLDVFIYSQQLINWAAVADIDGSIYSRSRAGNQINYDVLRNMEQDKESTQAAHGSLVWQACDDGSVLVKQMLYNWGSMKYMGYILVNLDRDLFDSVLKDMSHFNNGSISVLDSEFSPIFQIPENTDELSSYYVTWVKDTGNEIFRYQGKSYKVLSRKITKGNLTLLNIIDISNSTEALQQFTKEYLLICILFSLMISVISFFLVRPIGKDIRILMSGIDHIAAGEFDTRIQLHSRDEIAQIADNFNVMASRMSDLLQKLVDEERARQQSNYNLLEAQYHALQAQINPHFMFNALESISGIAKINEDSATSDLICRLSLLLRSNLERTNKFCPLSDEVGYVLNYLEFYQEIYPEKLKIDTRIDGTLNHYPVPTFILQPIVENAVVHGIGKKIGTGTLTLISCLIENDLVITISDDGIGIPEDKLQEIFSSKGKGRTQKRLGIRNVHERIQLLYGPQYGLTIHSKVNIGTCVTIRLPAESFEEEGHPCIPSH